MDNNDKKNDGKKNSPRSGWLFCLLAAVVLVFAFSYLSKQFEESSMIEISYNEFLEQLSAQEKYNATHNADGSAKTAISGSSSVQETTESTTQASDDSASFFDNDDLPAGYDPDADAGNVLDESTLTGDEPVIEKIEFVTNDERLLITPAKGTVADKSGITYYTGYFPDDKLQERCEEAGVDYSATYKDQSVTILDIFLTYILPLILIYGAFWLIMRMMNKGGGMFGGVGKSNAKVYMEKKTGITFADVAGEEEAKESVTELVDFLHNPGKYTRIGAKLPKGALLVGPPGTGKTLLAKAVAGEAGVQFFSLSGSDFVEMFVGVGASRVRDLFKQAQSAAPCIVFIDEIDAIGKSRDSRYGGGNDEREQTLNQLLAEMDGFDTSKGVVILAATNRPECLDKALLRPGRFDRRIIVDKPDLKGRIAILKVHAKNVFMHDSVNLDEIALATSGAVGSDLANIINEAAIRAVKMGRSVVIQEDLMESVEVVIAGKEKKDRILSEKEKKCVAYHEVGHALITALMKNSEPVQKITIVPRTMGSLGYVMQVPEEEKSLQTKEELIVKLVTFCGGRAAEQIVFGSVSTGAAQDIEEATNIARQMITRFGMSERFGLACLETVRDQYLDEHLVLNCADSTAAEVDHEVIAILKKCYSKACELISANREALDEIADYLFRHETITGKEFMKIFCGIKGIPVPEEKKQGDNENQPKPSDETENLNPGSQDQHIGESNVSEAENKEADDVLDGKLSDSSDSNKNG